jgi:DNA-binding transcriptional MocR family regulator
MLIPLKLVRDLPLQQQLYTRMLAEQFAVSRITVLLTYERLIAEGYLTTVPAKRTFVTQAPARQPVSPARRTVIDLGEVTAPAGRPDPRLFPAGRWRALIRDALDGLGASLAAEHADGDPALLAAIAHWLSTSRGLAVCPGQIILANGRQHALHIATHLLLHPGARAVIEQPCDPRAETLIVSTGAIISRIPVDQQGMRTDLLPEGPAALALVTPEHQRPLGAVMSESRRHALLAWAERAGATVVADDVDGELRYEAPRVRAVDGHRWGRAGDSSGRLRAVSGPGGAACLSGRAAGDDRFGTDRGPADRRPRRKAGGRRARQPAGKRQLREASVSPAENLPAPPRRADPGVAPPLRRRCSPRRPMLAGCT